MKYFIQLQNGLAFWIINRKQNWHLSSSGDDGPASLHVVHLDEVPEKINFDTQKMQLPYAVADNSDNVISFSLINFWTF